MHVYVHMCVYIHRYVHIIKMNYTYIHILGTLMLAQQ